MSDVAKTDKAAKPERLAREKTGGLIRWPIYALIPFGFALLFVQSVSELIKRAAFLTGNGPDPLAHDGPSDEELLAQQLLEEEQQRLKAAQ